MLKSIQTIIYGFQRGQSQPHVYEKDLSKIKIPLLSPDIQKVILEEVEKINQIEREGQEKIVIARQKIEGFFETIQQKATKKYKLSDNKSFSVNIGKRVLKRQLVPEGDIPVYSANVLEPFGMTHDLYINDFSLPSILWGIDGDWMVNFISENIKFYPTDHCGILRVTNKNIHPRYLAWALEKEGKRIGFSRDLRASTERISGITILAPESLEVQSEIISQIESLELEITQAQAIIDNTQEQKEAVLKKYL